MISVWQNIGFGCRCVISVHNESNINRLGETYRVGACLHRHEIDQMLTSRSFTEIAHHVRLDIGGKYFAFRDALCNPHAEITGARAGIGDKRSALQMQDVQNLLRLLPGIAFRIIELFGPFLRIVESMIEGPVGWTARDLRAPRAFRTNASGPESPEPLPRPTSSQQWPSSRVFWFSFCGFPAESFCSIPPGSEDAVCRCSAGIRVSTI